MLYREAVRLGLDRDDGLVREHLIQKMLLLAEDLGGASREPTRAEVKAYFDRTRDRWRQDERVHLVHVFATRRETAVGLLDATRAADALHPGAVPPVGEAFARSRDVRGSRAGLRGQLWRAASPMRSSHCRRARGASLSSHGSGGIVVKVLQHTPGAPAAFDDVFERVRLEYAVVHRHEAIAHFLEQAFKRYHVDVDGCPCTTTADRATRLAVGPLAGGLMVRRLPLFLLVLLLVAVGDPRPTLTECARPTSRSSRCRGGARRCTCALTAARSLPGHGRGRGLRAR